MVLKFIFPTNLYVKFQVPNAKEIIKTIDYYNESHVDNSKFIWGDKCSSGKISLKWEDYIELFKPSLSIFANQFNSYIQEMKSILNSLGYLDNEINDSIELITTKEKENNFLINSLSSEAKTELMDEHLKMILVKLSQKGT